MSWRFVGRTEQINRIRTALRDTAPGPIVITGESGMGRTSVLSRALDYVDGKQDSVIRVEPAGDRPFVALLPHLPDDAIAGVPLGDAVPAAAHLLAERAGGRRLVVAIDDAHLADHASMLAVRALHRRGDAVLLVTTPIGAEQDRRADATDALRYEPGVQNVSLQPLTIDEVAALLTGVVGGHVHPATTEALQAATEGNPRLLHDLVMGDRLLDFLVSHHGVWRLGEPPWPSRGEVTDDLARVGAAADRAWRELAVERAEELCRLALWRGSGERVAAVWANLLLLRGRAADSVRFLESLPDRVVEDDAELTLAEAMTLGLGLGSRAAVDDFLMRATSRNAALRDRLLAYRAWILAVTGHAVKAAEAVDGVRRSDRETAVFVHATRAVLAFTADRAHEAVFHLRRALAGSESCPGIPPWMRPYLTGCLIDAMLRAGRMNEGTAIANDFHAGEPGSGWEIAVTLTLLIAGRRPGMAARAA